MQRKLLKETGLKKCEDLNLSPCRVFQLGKCTLLLVFTPSKAFTIYNLYITWPIPYFAGKTCLAAPSASCLQYKCGTCQEIFYDPKTYHPVSCLCK